MWNILLGFKGYICTRHTGSCETTACVCWSTEVFGFEAMSSLRAERMQQLQSWSSSADCWAPVSCVTTATALGRMWLLKSYLSIWSVTSDALFVLFLSGGYTVGEGSPPFLRMNRQFITGSCMSICGFSTLGSALRVFWHLPPQRQSADPPLPEHLCLVALGLKPRTLCFVAQLPTDWATTSVANDFKCAFEAFSGQSADPSCCFGNSHFLSCKSVSKRNQLGEERSSVWTPEEAAQATDTHPNPYPSHWWREHQHGG